MQDRMKRRKKKTPDAGGGAAAGKGEPPLQPKYPDMDGSPRVEAEPEPASPETAAQPEAPMEGAGDAGARPWPKGKGRRRRRGGRGRGRRPQQAAQGTAEAPAEAAGQESAGYGEAGGVSVAEEPAIAERESEPAPEMAEERAPAHRPSEFDRQAEVPQAAVPISKATRGVVVLAIGLPGSGKSTWFKRHSVVPLSSDLLRTILFDDVTQQRYQDLVFSTLRALLRARLIARMPWNYVDATNLSPNERRGWIKMARDFGYEVHALFFDVPVEVCFERNRRRERVVPEDAMQRMASKLRPPSFDEGFSKITVVRVKQKLGNA